MPFQSKAQARAAWGGYLGSEMKDKAEEWSNETPGGISSLPEHVSTSRHSAYIHAPHLPSPQPKGR